MQGSRAESTESGCRRRAGKQAAGTERSDRLGRRLQPRLWA